MPADLLELEVPGWLRETVAPWRIESASLRREGVVLRLRSNKVHVPILVARAGRSMAVLDRRVPRDRAAALARALSGRVTRSPRFLAWSEQMDDLAAQMVQLADAREHGEPGPLEALRSAWPEREGDPTRATPPLPEVGPVELPRAARAALILHRFARGAVIDALGAWEQLPPTDAAGFTERHLDAVALAILGRRGDALEALAAAESETLDAAQWLTLARAYQTLSANEAAAAAHRKVVALRGTAWDHLRLASVPGVEVDAGRLRASPGSNDEQRASFARQAAKVLAQVERHDARLAVLTHALDGLAEPPVDLVAHAAQLHLWRMELDQAAAALARVEPTPPIQVLQAGVSVLAGEPEAALEILDAATLEGNDLLEGLLWAAEANLALGRDTEALACVEAHVTRENTLVAFMLLLLVHARTESDARLAQLVTEATYLDSLIADVLPTMCDAEALAAAHREPRTFATLIRDLLTRMGGNRTARPTWCRRSEDGRTTLEPVRVRPSGREAAVEALIRIRTEPPDVVLAGFEPVLEAYPSSPHPHTYRGELLIWLGRYEDALREFERADARAPTRWSHVGRAAAYDLLNDGDQSAHWTAQGALRFGELRTATTHVYRGERLRKTGDLAGAREDLEIALEVKTRRVGARVNLALVYRATGDEDGWRRSIDQLVRDAPALLFEAGVRDPSAIDERHLHTVLEWMAGNRSSFLHTAIDPDGNFRVIPAPATWIHHARLTVVAARRELDRALARTLLSNTSPGDGPDDGRG